MVRRKVAKLGPGSYGRPVRVSREVVSFRRWLAKEVARSRRFRKRGVRIGWTWL